MKLSNIKEIVVVIADDSGDMIDTPFTNMSGLTPKMTKTGAVGGEVGSQYPGGVYALLRCGDGKVGQGTATVTATKKKGSVNLGPLIIDLEFVDGPVDDAGQTQWAGGGLIAQIWIIQNKRVA